MCKKTNLGFCPGTPPPLSSTRPHKVEYARHFTSTALLYAPTHKTQLHPDLRNSDPDTRPLKTSFLLSKLHGASKKDDAKG
jgi:hypothetical protein